MMVHIAELEGIADFVAEDPVFVSLRYGVEPGMELWSDLLHIADSYGRRKQAIDGPAQVIRRNRVGEGNGSYLGPGMNAGVGPAGALDPHRSALYLADDTFQRSLDGGQVRLDLPAVKVGAVVGDGKADSAQFVQAAREPGLTATEPAAQSGQWSGS